MRKKFQPEMMTGEITIMGKTPLPFVLRQLSLLTLQFLAGKAKTVFFLTNNFSLLYTLA
jgi:hypothetical protein